MRRLSIFVFVLSVAIVIWAQRVSPKDDFFSVATPKGWNLTAAGDTLLWEDPDAHAQISASALAEQMSFSDARQAFEGRGFTVISSKEKIFHGFRCFYAYGNNASRDQKGVIYYCLTRRGSQRWSVFLFYFVDSNYENTYSPTFDMFLESFRWTDGVKDDH